MYDSGQDIEDGGGHPGYHDIDPNSVFQVPSTLGLNTVSWFRNDFFGDLDPSYKLVSGSGYFLVSHMNFF
jgi:hypothetical protein